MWVYVCDGRFVVSEIPLIFLFGWLSGLPAQELRVMSVMLHYVPILQQAHILAHAHTYMHAWTCINKCTRVHTN